MDGRSLGCIPRATPGKPAFASWAPSRESIPRVSGRSRERDRVAHIGESGDIGQRALEAEPKARRLTLTAATIHDQAELDAWLNLSKSAIEAALQAGPVIL